MFVTVIFKASATEERLIRVKSFKSRNGRDIFTTNKKIQQNQEGRHGEMVHSTRPWCSELDSNGHSLIDIGNTLRRVCLSCQFQVPKHVHMDKERRNPHNHVWAIAHEDTPTTAFKSSQRDQEISFKSYMYLTRVCVDSVRVYPSKSLNSKYSITYRWDQFIFRAKSFCQLLRWQKLNTGKLFWRWASRSYKHHLSFPVTKRRRLCVLETTCKWWRLNGSD